MLNTKVCGVMWLLCVNSMCGKLFCSDFIFCYNSHFMSMDYVYCKNVIFAAQKFHDFGM